MKTTLYPVPRVLNLTGKETSFSFFIKQFCLFGYLQAVSCIFPVIIFGSLALSTKLNLPIPRYDFLLVICLIAQAVLYLTRLETRDELLVITLFHFLGIAMELHKVHHGSWSYPEQAHTKVWGVPLYAGFMYASVGSYICQVWRNLSIETLNWPKAIIATIVGAAIYLNFFTNAFIIDLRWYITALILIVFSRTWFVYNLNGHEYRMHAVLSFILVGFFIWLGENIATFFNAWKYAYQHQGWKMVRWHKLSSWSLLVIVSMIIVGELKRLKASQVIVRRQ